MKKNVIIIFSTLLLIISICVLAISIRTKTNKATVKENSEYEKYLTSEIYGTDVITLINKAISSNEKNKITKDEQGFYINNNQNSIKIEIVMITNEEKEETTVYKMEAIATVGITEFIKNFNTEKFKCTKKEYHKETGKIAYIEITQQGYIN